MPTNPNFFFLTANRSRPLARPSLLKPCLLIAASSSNKRKARGFGLPNCGLGVNEPTSTNPHPSARIGSNASAFLSKPAARPIGFEKLIPKTSCSSIGSLDNNLLLGNSPHRKRLMARRCAAYGSIFENIFMPRVVRDMIGLP